MDTIFACCEGTEKEYDLGIQILHPNIISDQNIKITSKEETKLIQNETITKTITSETTSSTNVAEKTKALSPLLDNDIENIFSKLTIQNIEKSSEEETKLIQNETITKSTTATTTIVANIVEQTKALSPLLENDIQNIFSKLTIKSIKENTFNKDFYDTKILSYCGWKVLPKSSYRSIKEILDCLLNQELILNINPNTIPRLQLMNALPKEFVIIPYNKTMPPENKPSLFVMIMSLFLNEIKKTSQTSISNNDTKINNLLLHLNKYNIITPRNPIKKMISAMKSGQSWSMIASRPIRDGPIYLDRVESYKSNAGTIGMLFEKSMIIPSNIDYHRVYVITEGDLILNDDYNTTNDMKILMTGEVDCIDSETFLPVELKSKPSWIHNDNDRLFDNWFQSKLAGISTIVTGGFTCERGSRNGPVTFAKRNINYQSMEQYGTNISPTMKKQLFYQLYDVFNQIKQKLNVIKEGMVMKVSSNGNVGNELIIEEDINDNNCFPITTEILRNIAEACILFSS